MSWPRSVRTTAVTLAVCADGSKNGRKPWVMSARKKQPTPATSVTNRALITPTPVEFIEGTCNDGEQRQVLEGEPTAVAFAGQSVIVAEALVFANHAGKEDLVAKLTETLFVIENPKA